MGGTFAPWDLLIVDEAHHFAPKSTRDEKIRMQMMRRLTKWFEHRLFLTATPHDGYTVSAADFKDALYDDHGVEGQTERTWWTETARKILDRAADAGLVDDEGQTYEWIEE